MTIVADRYAFVVGVDTHARSNTYAIPSSGREASSPPCWSRDDASARRSMRMRWRPTFTLQGGRRAVRSAKGPFDAFHPYCERLSWGPVEAKIHQRFGEHLALARRERFIVPGDRDAKCRRHRLLVA